METEPKQPMSVYLIDRLRAMPKSEQAQIMRQAGILQVGAKLGLTSALELLYKMGSLLNDLEAK